MREYFREFFILYLNDGWKMSHNYFLLGSRPPNPSSQMIRSHHKRNQGFTLINSKQRIFYWNKKWYISFSIQNSYEKPCLDPLLSSLLEKSSASKESKSYSFQKKCEMGRLDYVSKFAFLLLDVILKSSSISERRTTKWCFLLRILKILPSWCSRTSWIKWQVLIWNSSLDWPMLWSLCMIATFDEFRTSDGWIYLFILSSKMRHRII